MVQRTRSQCTNCTPLLRIIRIKVRLPFYIHLPIAIVDSVQGLRKNIISIYIYRYINLIVVIIQKILNIFTVRSVTVATGIKQEEFTMVNLSHFLMESGTFYHK